MEEAIISSECGGSNKKATAHILDGCGGRGGDNAQRLIRIPQAVVAGEGHEAGE